LLIHCCWSELSNRKCFVHFLTKVLSIDPSSRLTPLQASRHPFITGKPFSGRHFLSVKFCCSCSHSIDTLQNPSSMSSLIRLALQFESSLSELKHFYGILKLFKAPLWSSSHRNLRQLLLRCTQYRFVIANILCLCFVHSSCIWIPVAVISENPFAMPDVNFIRFNCSAFAATLCSTSYREPRTNCK
jgi:serine/threonine protein kinase